MNRLRELHQHRPVAALALSSLVALGLSNLGTRAGAQVAPPPVARFLAAQTPAAAATPVDPPGRATLFPDGLRAVWSSQDGRSVLTSTRASAGAAWGTPNRLLTTRGVVRRIVVAPDGASLAYENQRSWKGDGAPDDTWQFICVYDIPTRQISYIDPVFAVDADPVWTVDSARISFVRKVVGLPDAHLTRPVVRPRLAGWTPPPLKPSEKFTLASVIAAPFIYPPGSSADGTAIAYVTREGRARNVYFMRLGDAARRLASYPQDDGQDLSDPPALSKTGAAIAYVRGGPINRQGDAPNPTAAADMPAQQVWLVGAKDDAPRLIGPGHDPLFTPDDRYLIWQSDSLMAAPLIWRDGRLAGVGAPEEFLTGQRNGLSFSPHGGRLAYERGGGIEVYDFTAKTTVVVPHGAEIDQGPVWSPDGTRLAFRRTSANSPNWLEGSCGNYRYCGPLVSADPWSIWTVDTATLQPRKIWQAKPGVGSVFYPLDQSYSPSEHGNQLLWSGNDQIAFAWEGDGWRHLYVVSATGGEARLLTPGDGEVETAALSMDRTRIIYSANIGDLGRRHIFSVNFDGQGKPLTAGDQASQWSPLPLAGGATGYVDAGWADPPVVRVLNASGGITTAALPASPPGFPAQLLVKPTLVEFPAQDGQTAFGQMFTPEHPTGCAIIFSHGGIKRQMLPGFHYMDAYAYLYEMNQYLAGRGCVVLSVEYRSSIMRGEAFRDAPGWGFANHSELMDFVGAAKYLLSQKGVDPRRGVGVYGLSWGGYMTSQLLARHSDLFKVGFDMAGVHTTEDPAGFAQSAIGSLKGWNSPVFLAQGDDDMNVDFDQGMALADALQVQRPQVEFKQRVLPGQTHDLYLTYEQLVGIYREGSDFLIEHLGAPP